MGLPHLAPKLPSRHWNLGPEKHHLVLKTYTVCAITLLSTQEKEWGSLTLLEFFLFQALLFYKQRNLGLGNLSTSLQFI